MKKLICEKDILEFAAGTEKKLRVDTSTILTPSAKDAANKYGIEIVYAGMAEQAKTEECACEKETDRISPDMIADMLIDLVRQNKISPSILTDLMADKIPFRFCKDSTGLKHIQGRSVQLEPFFEGNSRINYREFVSDSESRITSGILEIDHDSYEWTLDYDENDYVIEGVFVVEIGGNTYKAQAGDTIFIPKGSKVRMGCKNEYCKVFYNTCDR